MSSNVSGIYGIENKINGKWYIGQSVNIKKRWNEHIANLTKGSHRNVHLQSAWKKYGADAFSFHILELCDRERLNIREVCWVKEKNSFENGYNNTLGGDGAPGWKATDEARRKMSIAHKGQKRSAETVAKMKAARKTSVSAANHMKRLRELKISREVTEKERAHLVSLNEPRRKAVLCVETGCIYASAHEAAQAVGTYQSNISKCCREPTTTHRGCHWRYVNE